MFTELNANRIGAQRGQEGYLLDPASWDEHIALAFATEEALTLHDEHWQVLHFMRGYWHEHQVAPDVRHVIGFLATTQGIDKRAAKENLFRMFPYGYVKQACKIAGMIRPLAWSTS